MTSLFSIVLKFLLEQLNKTKKYIYIYFYIYIFLYIYNGKLFSHEKEGNPAICSNMDEPLGHYAK